MNKHLRGRDHLRVRSSAKSAASLVTSSLNSVLEEQVHSASLINLAFRGLGEITF